MADFDFQNITFQTTHIMFPSVSLSASKTAVKSNTENSFCEVLTEARLGTIPDTRRYLWLFRKVLGALDRPRYLGNTCKIYSYFSPSRNTQLPQPGYGYESNQITRIDEILSELSWPDIWIGSTRYLEAF